MEQIFSTINNYDDINKDFQAVIDIVPRIVTCKSFIYLFIF